MPQFRIPFTSKKNAEITGLDANRENVKPNAVGTDTSNPYADKPSLALGQKESREEPNEFKLSMVDSNGQYLPPSPAAEKKSFWSTKSSASSNHRSILSETEPFSISRESFESYRRSFDISGRSPIITADSFTSRSSLDSRNLRLPRSSINGNTYEPPRKVEDAGFEDVKLNEDTSKQQPKKKSFLSRFGDSGTDVNGTTDSKSHHFHIGRRRGQSGSGAELGEVNRPSSKGNVAEVTVR